MEEFLQRLPEITQNIPEAIPRLLLTLIALILIFRLRQALSGLMMRPVRWIAQKTNSQLAETILEAMRLPARLLVIALALYVSLEILRPDQATGEFVTNLLRSLVIVALLLALYRIVDMLALSSNRLFAATGIHLEERLLPLVRTAIKVVIMALAVIIVMQEWSIDVSGLVASLGIVGLAFSLAAQDTVSNLFGFSTIVGDRPFVIGEYIITSEVEGIVEEVGIRSTRIRKPDRAIVTVPNSQLATSAVQRFAKRRISFILGVTYDTTADQMEELLKMLRDMLTTREHVISNTVAVYFTGFGDSSLDITIFCDLTLRDWRAYLQERESINLQVMRTVANLGLSVAFPSRTIYIESMPPGAQL